MYWLKQHLNWTLVIGIGLGMVISFFITLVYILIFPSATELNIFFLSFLPYILVVFTISLWVLRQKGRCLWWVLLVGFYSPFWLENKNNQPEWARYLTPKNQ
jgi:hypothetical protein